MLAAAAIAASLLTWGRNLCPRPLLWAVGCGKPPTTASSGRPHGSAHGRRGHSPSPASGRLPEDPRLSRGGCAMQPPWPCRTGRPVAATVSARLAPIRGHSRPGLCRATPGSRRESTAQRPADRPGARDNSDGSDPWLRRIRCLPAALLRLPGSPPNLQAIRAVWVHLPSLPSVSPQDRPLSTPRLPEP